ncbi:MAG: DUF4918 family protein [Saprospiraceae bacterium]|nr:DUF4918 family protein [Saprospiraceae bacterium]
MQVPFPGSFGDKVLDYQFGLVPSNLPDGIQWLYPFDSSDVRAIMRRFFGKFFNDDHSRCLLWGINPGRFGAGVTGVPFTDPIRLQQDCGIPNDFEKRQELSSLFVYEFIEVIGGVQEFYKNFYITSVCPLGFTKDRKNYNYYDDKKLLQAVEPLIIENIQTQIRIGSRQDIAFSMGKGKNFQYLNKLNDKYNFFQTIQPLPHPRWVMQYRLKRKAEFVQEYVSALNSTKS